EQVGPRGAGCGRSGPGCPQGQGAAARPGSLGGGHRHRRAL
ncbi:MAG: hypothetical protein AVDCRST_MAG24-1546, partial [uncultured Nocardioidaceae bacterium]